MLQNTTMMNKFRAKQDVNFIDGTKHFKGNVYEATEETTAYFSVCFRDYDKV